MNPDELARRILDRLDATEGSILRALTPVELQIYGEWLCFMRYFNPRSPEQPDSDYQADFCQSELTYLRTLTEDVPTGDEPLLDYSLKGNRGQLISVVNRFMPAWCANTATEGRRETIFAVYTYLTADGDTFIYLVNEGLRIPKGYEDRGHVPLQRLYEDTWYAFDAFPYPYNRKNGRPVKLR